MHMQVDLDAPLDEYGHTTLLVAAMLGLTLPLPLPLTLPLTLTPTLPLTLTLTLRRGGRCR